MSAQMNSGLPPQSIENSLALALADHDVALWLGPDWTWQESKGHASLAEHDWLGIWSESRDPATAQYLARNWVDRPFRRTFVEVPDQIHEVLDRDFKFARICPFFYLAGREPEKSRLTPKRQTILRASHVDQIERLGPATLVIAGVRDPQHLLALLTDDLEVVLPNLRQIVVTCVECPQNWRDALVPLGNAANRKVQLHGDSLPDLLVRLAAAYAPAAQDAGDQLLVGKHKKPLSLRGLLRTDPPVDQFFHIVTARDIRPAEPAENRHDMMVNLLGGLSLPWRPFRHHLHWQRPTAVALLDQMLSLLSRMSAPAAPSVRCLNIEADAGAGLTVLLQLLAFHAADHGYPTLIARESSQRFEYDVLRTFLVDLDHQAAELNAEGSPVVIVIDAGASDHDPTNAFKELPRRLRASGRRALLIRGAEVLKDLPTPTAMDSGIEVARLRSALSSDDYDRLRSWVTDTYARLYPENIAEKVGSADAWAQGNTKAPEITLLVALYFLLQDDLRRAGDFGKHLLKPVAKVVNEVAAEHHAQGTKGGLPVRLSDGTTALLKFGAKANNREISPQQIVEAVLVTAAAARINESIPIAVLGTMIGADTTGRYRILDQLVQQFRFSWPQYGRFRHFNILGGVTGKVAGARLTVRRTARLSPRWQGPVEPSIPFVHGRPIPNCRTRASQARKNGPLGAVQRHGPAPYACKSLSRLGNCCDDPPRLRVNDPRFDKRRAGGSAAVGRQQSPLPTNT